MVVEIKHDGVYLNGKRLIGLSASIHFWRVDPRNWSKLLDRVVELGYGIVCTYVHWAFHELSPGRYDFTGETDPRRDLDGFLELCKSKGLYVILRPGPLINAELTYFGFPKRIFHRRDLLARTRDGNLAILPVALPAPFFIPCYVSEEFVKEYAPYLEEFCRVVRKHLVTNGGCVILVQAENENSYCFRFSPYDIDYSNPSIECYREFLKQKYGAIGELNKRYGTRYTTWNEVSPPKEFDPKRIVWCLDYGEYKRHYLMVAVKKVAEILKSNGIDVPITHNLPIIDPRTEPMSVGLLEERAVDVCGIDIYRFKENYIELMIGCEYLRNVSKMAMAPEFSAGCPWVWGKPITPRDQRMTQLTAYMHGIKFINNYMIVERDRWIGSPISSDANIQRGFHTFKKLVEIYKQIDLQSLEKKNDIILLINRDYELLSYVATIPFPLLPIFSLGETTLASEVLSVDDVGLRDQVHVEYKREFNGWLMGMVRRDLDFSIGDSHSTKLEKLKEYKVAMIHSFEYMSKNVQCKLLDYVRGGGCLLIAPRCPVKDETFDECEVFAEHLTCGRSVGDGVVSINGMDISARGVEVFDREGFAKIGGRCCGYEVRIGDGRIIHLGFLFSHDDKCGELLEQLVSELGATRYCFSSTPWINTALHVDGGRMVIFVANWGDVKRRVRVTCELIPEGAKLLDVWSGEVLDGGREFEVEVDGHDVRVLEVE